MMINNVLLTKIERNGTETVEDQYGFATSFSAKGTKNFLDGIKSSISSNVSKTSFSSSSIVETLDVKTTKSVLLRQVIEKCISHNNFEGFREGDLVKINNVRLEILDEESLRQFLILRRDTLKGVRFEGIELKNVISSMLQDYAYILKGTIQDKNCKNTVTEIIIKIPFELSSEFENKYSINDLLIGHVSIVGIYKGYIKKESVLSNTFNYFQEVSIQQNPNAINISKITKSYTPPLEKTLPLSSSQHAQKDSCHFLDILAIIQDVSYYIDDTQVMKLHWWNKLSIWLSKLRRW